VTQPDPLSNGEFKPLPPEAVRICERLSAPPRLVAHLVLVHDTACILIDRIAAEFPEAHFDPDLVRFGAALHDIGKILHPNELTESGKNKHQRSGVELLQSLGIPKKRARFAWTHSNWTDTEQITLEDLLVALADKTWKGKRIDALESLTADLLSTSTARPKSDCYAKLVEIIQSLSQHADKKLAWQSSFPV
jgi:putative nucleotidyltransferase with HDIG domain